MVNSVSEKEILVSYSWQTSKTTEGILRAVRQIFTDALATVEQASYLTVSGKVLVGGVSLTVSYFHAKFSVDTVL